MRKERKVPITYSGWGHWWHICQPRPFWTMKGYRQCPLDEESQLLTTFIMPFSRFKVYAWNCLYVWTLQPMYVWSLQWPLWFLVHSGWHCYLWLRCHTTCLICPKISEQMCWEKDHPEPRQVQALWALYRIPTLCNRLPNWPHYHKCNLQISNRSQPYWPPILLWLS